MSKFNFFSEEIPFSLTNKAVIKNWLLEVSKHHERIVDTINYIFCSDEYLLQINKDFLAHDYYTDIITFDNSTDSTALVADIFISVDRVTENAIVENVSFERELHRVMAHGLLHLLGFNDKTEDEKILMRQNEDACLSLLKL
ncbi:MAG: rRNA maturation RNase YbeY [Marinoscillum sp.]